MLPRDPVRKIWQLADCIDIPIDSITQQYYGELLDQLEGGEYPADEKLQSSARRNASQEDLNNSFDTLIVRRVDTKRTVASQNSPNAKRRSKISLSKHFSFRKSQSSSNLDSEISFKDEMNEFYDMKTEEVSSGDEE
jgi:hypothetical protein